jgi:hypothetical protein
MSFPRPFLRLKYQRTSIMASSSLTNRQFGILIVVNLLLPFTFRPIHRLVQDHPFWDWERNRMKQPDKTSSI